MQSWDEVPAFATEAEEAAWWQTRSLGKRFLEAMQPATEVDADLPAPRPRTRPLAVRFDEMTVARLKALANRRQTGYQTLLKQFVIERLYEEEKRAGIVRGAVVTSGRARPATAVRTSAKAEESGQRPKARYELANRSAAGSDSSPKDVPSRLASTATCILPLKVSDYSNPFGPVNLGAAVDEH